jgi:hypothetical protein
MSKSNNLLDVEKVKKLKKKEYDRLYHISKYIPHPKKLLTEEEKILNSRRYAKRWVENNKERKKENDRKYQKANVEEKNRYNREYYKLNHETLRKKDNESRLANKDRHNMARKEYKSKLKSEVFNAYGNRCKCCGETRQELLTIDHIFNDGNLDRKKHRSGIGLYSWIRQNNFPKDRFQLLCWNCNCSKGLSKDHICIHKLEKLSPPKSIWSFAV